MLLLNCLLARGLIVQYCCCWLVFVVNLNSCFAKRKRHADDVGGRWCRRVPAARDRLHVMSLSSFNNRYRLYFAGIIASVGIDELHNQAAAMQTTKRWNNGTRNDGNLGKLCWCSLRRPSSSSISASKHGSAMHFQIGT